MKTVFVLDDDPDSADLLTDALTAPGREIRSFVNSLRAIAALGATVHVDALVTDLEMPWVDGFDVVEVARGYHRNIQAIIVSGNADSCEKAAKVGANFLAKPVDLVRLRSMVDEMLSAGEKVS